MTCGSSAEDFDPRMAFALADLKAARERFDGDLALYVAECADLIEGFARDLRDGVLPDIMEIPA